MPADDGRENERTEQEQKYIERKNVEPFRRIGEDSRKKASAYRMFVEAREESLERRQKEKSEKGDGKERRDVKFPDPESALPHPAGAFSPIRFTFNGEHSDKSRKEEKSFRSGKKSEALVEVTGNRTGKMIQRHLQQKKPPNGIEGENSTGPRNARIQRVR